MTINTVDGLLAAMPGQMLSFLKVIPALQSTGQWYSPWLLSGIPGAGVAPSSGAAGNTLDDSVAGAMPFTNAASGLHYISRAICTGTVAGTLVICDRLWHNSGLSATALTAQTVNSVALPSRCPVLTDVNGETFDALGNGVEAWFPVLGTAMGAGATPPSISYTDESGNAGSVGTAINWLTTAAIGRTFPFSLAAGDRGVRSIQSMTNGATMTSGAFALVLRRRILTLPVSISAGSIVLGWDDAAMPAIPSDAHLELLWIPSTGATLQLSGDIMLIGG
jgi:hypothetical protein